MDEKKENVTNDEKKECLTQVCRYNEICNKEKMCTDCAMDDYEIDQYEQALENFKLDRKTDRYF